MLKIKVLLVDDQNILLDGIKSILETDNQIEVVGTADNGETAIAIIEKNLPDVVLMDIRMPKMNGVQCTKAIKERWPDISVLMLTTFDDEEYIFEALKYGACGYFLKDIRGEKLLQAIKDAYRGDTILPSKIAARIAGRVVEKSESKEERLKNSLGLSDREAEIALMLSQGFTNKQIASVLYIVEGTVKNYISTIYSKLGVEDRTLAAIRIGKTVE